MRGGTTNEYQPAGLWSYTADQRFEPVKPTTTTTVNTYNPSSVQRVPNVQRKTSPSPSQTLSTWRCGNSEVKRKQRVMSYKAYAVEGKMKGSIRNSFRWVKNKYSSIVYGY
ncbi:hypothetical protein ACJIZ3_018145 [Penstemon smallii]|uniref:Uncharacterized protein n=1 Tax=Penstemon smallii TaxID=265156 RepID=A0ABD3SY24_9LAMI